jgi:hypothetical protein
MRQCVVIILVGSRCQRLTVLCKGVALFTATDSWSRCAAKQPPRDLVLHGHEVPEAVGARKRVSGVPLVLNSSQGLLSEDNVALVERVISEQALAFIAAPYA